MSAVLGNVPVALLSPLHGQIVIANFCCSAVNSVKQFLNKGRPTLMTLALLCQFTAQHVSDVNTSIFRSLQLLGCVIVLAVFCCNDRGLCVNLFI